MIVEEKAESSVCLKDTAETAFNSGDFNLASEYYKKLLDDSSENDQYCLSKLGQALRKIGKSGDFIAICRPLFLNKKYLFENNYVNDTLCWCLYECHIQKYVADDEENFEQFLKSAEFIKGNSHQKNADCHFHNPFVLTIRKVVEIYKSKASTNYKKIIEWLDSLDPDRLSEEIFQFEDSKGKEWERASDKEFYYQHYTKALEKNEQFSKCIEKCENALASIKKFHYRNETWIKARLYYSRCMVEDDLDNALTAFETLSEKEKYWFMYHKLSQVFYRLNKMEQSLFYACKAFIGRFEEERMVNLMFDLGICWESNGDIGHAKLFFQTSAYYRKRYHWNCPEELEYRIMDYDLDVSEKPNIKKMQKICQNYIILADDSVEKFEGQVNNLLSPHNKSGFITPQIAGNNIYFNMGEVHGQVKKGTKVIYELGEDKQRRPIAVNIFVVEG